MKKENEEILRARWYEKRGRFQPELRDELIKAIEAGTPRSVIVYQYGVSRTAISKWMRDHSSEAYSLFEVCNFEPLCLQIASTKKSRLLTPALKIIYPVHR